MVMWLSAGCLVPPLAATLPLQPSGSLMPGDDLTLWMWSQACRQLERAESLHRRFFGLADQAGDYSWEPPADVFETEREILIELALPGVSGAAVEVAVEGGVL